MENKNRNISKFWFGFALGAGTGATALVLLGTRKGREILKKLIDMSEGLEEHVETILDEVSTRGVEKLDQILQAKKLDAKRP